LDPVSGSVLWQADVPGTYPQVPHSAHGVVIIVRQIGSPAGATPPTTLRPNLVALGARDGKVRWTQRTRGAEPLVLTTDTLVLTAELNKLTALDAATGRVRWSVTTPRTHIRPLEVQGSQLLVETSGSPPDLLSVYDVSTGRVVVQLPIRHATTARLTGTGGLLLLEQGGTLSSVQPPSSVPTWTTSRVRASGTLTVSAGVTVVTGLTGPDEISIVAMEASSGRELWRAPTDAPSRGEPVIVGDTVAFARRGTIVAVDVHTGQRRWARPGGRDKLAAQLEPPAILDVDAGRVIALAAGDGHQLWAHKLDAPAAVDAVIPQVQGVAGGPVVVSVGWNFPRYGD
jgi:outer membrane protein assembly factor BamB